MTGNLSTSAFLTAATAGNTQQTAGTGRNLSPQEAQKLKETARDFEAMFLTEMLNHMNSGIEVDPMFGGGRGEEIFRGMLNQEYASIASKSGTGIGLADHVQKAMLALQENAGRKQD